MEKVLTVSVAAYNVEKYIDECLKSFLVPEVMDDIEVFVIDDGGTDDTEAIARKYEEQYPDTFKFVHKENGGWGSTLNYGIEHASGKYFKPLDGDDYFQKENLKKYIYALKSTNADVVYTGYTTFEDGSGKIISVDGIVNDYSFGKIQDMEKVTIPGYITMHTCSFRTEMLKKFHVSVMEHCFYTDTEYVMKGFFHAKTIEFENFSVYRYRVGREEQSMSMTGLCKHYREHIRMIKKLLALYDKAQRATIKEMLKKRCRELIDFQNVIFLHLRPTREHARDFRNFDKLIKHKYPEFYGTVRKRVKTFRILGSWSYPFVIYKNTDNA